MQDVARKKSPARGMEDLPEWMRDLKGFDEIVVEQSADGTERAHLAGSEKIEFASGVWQVNAELPDDLNEIADRLDPIIILAGLTFAAEQVDSKLTEVVRFCRSSGKTWTQIGEALGMSKQAAWERFSGEE